MPEALAKRQTPKKCFIKENTESGNQNLMFRAHNKYIEVFSLSVLPSYLISMWVFSIGSNALKNQTKVYTCMLS